MQGCREAIRQQPGILLHVPAIKPSSVSQATLFIAAAHKAGLCDRIGTGDVRTLGAWLEGEALRR